MDIELAAQKVSNLLVRFGSRCTIVAAFDPLNPHIEIWTDEQQLISKLVPHEIDGFPIEIQSSPNASAQIASKLLQ
ncbi:MAG TPA: hypothetical protein VFX23_10875 [Limnobacter sp.]|nr:hypothetical protein [Limnobacter sp.]